MDTDHIEKQIMLAAPLERVWNAISDSKAFGSWFGMEFDGPFVAGAHLRGKIVPTSVDEEIGKSQKPYEGLEGAFLVDRVQPMHTIAFRWHPYAIEPNVDYSSEPATLVVFRLEETENGTLLTIRESGFGQIPLSRRAEVFDASDSGWSMQTKLIEKYLAMNRDASRP